MTQIPIFNSTSSDFTQEIELEGVFITIRLIFDIRNESWFMSINTENNEIKNIRLIYNFPILKQYKYIFPEIKGDFFIQKLNDITGDDITYNNLGENFTLFYYTETELNSWLETYGLD